MSEKITKTCLICGSPLQDVDGRGRPRRYCNTTCRRMAELDTKRCDRRLAALEDMRSNARISAFPTLGFDVTKVEAEIALQRARLRELLSRAPSTPSDGD